MILWHRLFGLALSDFFADSPFVVELETDLSLKRQFLDVVILRQREGDWAQELPDGLDNLSVHNLLSYKSLQEPLDDWALKELTGHYVNYRKQVSPSFDNLLAEKDFRLYGVSTRFPQKLAAQIELHSVMPGVFDIVRGTDNIRIIVLSQIARAPRNAIWQLFSGVPEAIALAARHYRDYRAQASEMSTIIDQLFKSYQLEGLTMPYTMEDFQKDYLKEHLDVLSTEERLKGLSAEEILKQLSPEERLKGISPDERLKGISPDERLKGISPDERLKGISPDERLKGISPDERLKGISLEEIQQYLKKIQDQ